MCMFATLPGRFGHMPRLESHGVESDERRHVIRKGFSIAKQQLSLSGKTENTHVGHYPPATARALGTASTVGPGSGQNGEDSAPGVAVAAAAAAALGLSLGSGNSILDWSHVFAQGHKTSQCWVCTELPQQQQKDSHGAQH
ncbi:uncharacterized protein RBU33_003298 [Hipposideros larvatus]